MAHRYAVLLDKSTDDVRPVGMAIEYPGGVFIDLPSSYCVPVEQTGEYRVLQPDLTEVIYRPGDVGYLDQVLIDLFWGFAIGEMGEIEQFTATSYARLFANVLASHAHLRTESYAVAQTSYGAATYEAAEREMVEMQPALNVYDLAVAA